MPITLCKGSDVKTIIRSLPTEQIEHMIHVGAFVSVMTQKICDYSIYSEISEAKGCQQFGNAAFYHDIGKAYIPQEILLKSNRLTPEEFRMVQKHPVFAKELFLLINRGEVSGMPAHLLPLAHDSAVYHHEWWNGNGYPYGICRKDIPLIARITAICDAYDAITNDRVYRRAHTHCYACRELEINAGTQFDPTLIKVFLDNESAFLALAKNDDRFNYFQCLA
ncbi:HD-GYP domain-containing protein [Clostridium aminobutyricum]|uniref:HD domain-containing protein n=1 Tax=Clostridium aminobutyricum TaxID=33953 RepID=A0A939D6I7_CLOAM|nr:HD domain-containing phosphohydrolase [Clostridium aminobutyricum]MBN7771743.1 HD domain-containing protein [Clostridium aminobutyricum]